MLPIGDENNNPRGFHVVTLVLVVLNVLVYLYESILGESALNEFIFRWGMIPAEIERSQDLYTLFTSMFVHGGLAHIGSNMLFLWIFGDNIERRFGSALFLAFYLGTGLAAGIAHYLTDPGSTIPTVGASGAISGVLGAYLLLYPFNRVRVLVGLYGYINVRAFLFLGIWFVLQLASGLATLGMPEGVEAGGVAVWAHIGGFVAGAVVAVILGRLRSEPSAALADLARWQRPPDDHPWR